MIQIKTYSSEYKDDLYGFLAVALEESGYSFLIKTKDRDLAHIESEYLRHNGSFFLAFDDTTIVGSIGIRNIGANIGELKRFYVLKSHQGRGVGLNLIEQTIKHAQEKGFECLRLDTMKRSNRAIKIFRRQGFQEIPRYNDDPYAEVFMELRFPRSVHHTNGL